MELFAKIVNGWKLLAIFAKSSILDTQLGFEYASRTLCWTCFSRPVFSQVNAIIDVWQAAKCDLEIIEKKLEWHQSESIDDIQHISLLL